MILDGGVGTELPHAGRRQGRARRAAVGHARADREPRRRAARAPRVRRRPAATSSRPTPGAWPRRWPTDGPRLWPDRDTPVHWMDVGRRGLRLARQARARARAATASARSPSRSTATSTPTRRPRRSGCSRACSPTRPSRPTSSCSRRCRCCTPSLDAAIEGLLATGLPVWLSFRRCRHGLCGIYGQHWGGPEGDAFGRAARRFEEMGVGRAAHQLHPARPRRGDGLLPARLHRPAARRLPQPRLLQRPRLALRRPASAARSTPRWRCAGARRARRSSAAAAACAPSTSPPPRSACAGTLPGHRAPDRRRPRAASTARDGRRARRAAGAVDRPPPARRCTRCRSPTSASSPGVAPPSAASYMAWRYVFGEGIGAHQRCLDIGCGTGILAVQLALNGAAARARARHRRPRGGQHAGQRLPQRRRRPRHGRRPSTSSRGCPRSATRSSSRASTRSPTDPFERVSSHRLPDYWGRNLVDQLIAKLSEALAPEGVAYVVQLSILSQRHTADALAAARLRRPGGRLHAVLLPARAGGEPRADRARRGAQRRLPPDRRRARR